MNISHLASRPRSVESGEAFFQDASHITDSNTHKSSSSSGWHFAFLARIRSADGPKNAYAALVLRTLHDYADANGRAWPGIQRLLTETKIKTERALQKALKELVRDGWLRITRQTWAARTAIHLAAGKKAPRRGDVGQATNLYVLLDGRGQEATFLVSPRPGLARTANNTQHGDNASSSQNKGSHLCRNRGGPPAISQPDLDQVGTFSREERVERAQRVDQSTHISSKRRKKGEENLVAWNVLVEAHIEKTKAVYGLPPMRPDVKRDEQQALAALLDEAATDVRAKLHERTGLEHTLDDVRQDLAKRLMHLYFKRDNEHLRRVKHALRDLPREFHARLTEAMNLVLRESHDHAPPRRATLEQPSERIASTDKPVEIEPKKQPEPTTARLEPADKPAEVAPPKPPERVSHADVAREARRLLQTLNAASSQQELFRPPTTETKKPEEPAKPALPERKLETPEATKVSETKPVPNEVVQDKPASTTPITLEQQPFEQQPFEQQPSPHVEHALGRSGAPRWGAIGPRPTKVAKPTKKRRVRKLLRDKAESKEEHGGGSTPI